MSTRRRSRGALVATVVCLAIAGCGGATGPEPSPTPIPGSTTSADYQRGYRVGLKAYAYGLPLLVTDATFRTMTSVNVSQGAFGPVNQFNSVRSPNTSGSTAVVAPGASSLSSIAWLDLRDEPQVIHLPRVVGHSYTLSFLDPYTENIVNLSSANATPPGDYVVVNPQQRDVTIPAGTHRVDVDYSRIWIIGSTQLKGPDDIAAVNKIQDGYTLTPLSAYGTDYKPPAPAVTTTTVTKYTPAAGIQFFDDLGAQLAEFPPPAADDPALKRFASVGVGPGLTPSTNKALSSDTLRGLTDAVAAGPAQIQRDTKASYAAGFTTHNGYFLGGFGKYGTDYTKRAVISKIGLGAFVATQAIYAMSWSDRTKTPLDGATTYTLHLAKPPPTKQGWSVTVYNLQGGLVANPQNRYALTDTSKVTRKADGSIDFILASTQPSDPAKAANWLPTPAGAGFEVMWRLMAPVRSDIDEILDGSGWQPPPIKPAG